MQHKHVLCIYIFCYDNLRVWRICNLRFKRKIECLYFLITFFRKIVILFNLYYNNNVIGSSKSFSLYSETFTFLQCTVSFYYLETVQIVISSFN